MKGACERAERPRTGDPRTATDGHAELRAELIDLCGPGTEDAGIKRRKLGWMLRNATGRVARITDPGEAIPGAMFSVRLESWKPRPDDKPHYRVVKIDPSTKVGS